MSNKGLYGAKILVDILKGHKLYSSLQKYNRDIIKATEGYVMQSDRNYDLTKKEASFWFDPGAVRNLPMSSNYPGNLPIQQDPRLDLVLYVPNYFSLLLINTLYRAQNINIEEQACGMGRLSFYLSKLGFEDFHLMDNFTQMPKTLLDALMGPAGIKYTLNDIGYKPTVLNLVGYTYFIKPVLPETELVIISDNTTLVIDDAEKGLMYRDHDLVKYSPLEGKVCLAEDVNGVGRAYCNKDKVDEFVAKLKQYRSDI